MNTKIEIKRLTVNLESCGNPDHGQYESISPKQSVIVSSLEEASQECRRYIEEWDLGGGNWMGGEVYQGNKLVAEISYNGRVNLK